MTNGMASRHKSERLSVPRDRQPTRERRRHDRRDQAAHWRDKRNKGEATERSRRRARHGDKRMRDAVLEHAPAAVNRGSSQRVPLDRPPRGAAGVRQPGSKDRYCCRTDARHRSLLACASLGCLPYACASRIALSRDFLSEADSAWRSPRPHGDSVARREIHADRRLASVEQDLFHHAVLLDEIAPVVGAEKPQAGDAIAHRNLIGGLGLPIRPHKLFDGETLLGNALLQPTIREGEVGTLALQVTRDLGKESARQRRIGPRHVRHHQDQVGRVLLDDLHHPLGPVVGRVSIAPAPAIRTATRRRFSISASRNMIGTAHNSPSFSGCTDLVGGDEAVRGRRRPRARRHGRSIPGRCRRRAGKVRPDRSPAGAIPGCTTAASAAGPCGSALRSDRNCRAAIRRPANCVVFAWRPASRVRTSDENRFVLVQSRNELVGRPPGRELMGRRQALGMPLELLNVEQLGPQRLLFL